MTFHHWWVAAMAAVLFIAWTPEIVGEWRTKRLQKQHAADTYLTVDYVNVGNSVVGDPVIIDVKREILREFRGTYTVEVRTFPRREVVCLASKSLNYRPDSNTPEEIDLHWWADDGVCSGPDLDPGEYMLVTTWVIHSETDQVPDQSITIDSNPFSVSAVSAAQAERAIKQIEEIGEAVEELRAN